MSVDVVIKGSSGIAADVTIQGELCVSAAPHSTPSQATLDAIDTGVSFITPKSRELIVIDGIILGADKNVHATTSGLVEVYESTTGAGETVAVSILKLSMIKNQTESFLPLNTITTAGNWVMAKTSDASIEISIYYHYVSA